MFSIKPVTATTLAAAGILLIAGSALLINLPPAPGLPSPSLEGPEPSPAALVDRAQRKVNAYFSQGGDGVEVVSASVRDIAGGHLKPKSTEELKSEQRRLLATAQHMEANWRAARLISENAASSLMREIDESVKREARRLAPAEAAKTATTFRLFAQLGAVLVLALGFATALLSLYFRRLERPRDFLTTNS